MAESAAVTPPSAAVIVIALYALSFSSTSAAGLMYAPTRLMYAEAIAFSCSALPASI